MDMCRNLPQIYVVLFWLLDCTVVHAPTCMSIPGGATLGTAEIILGTNGLQDELIQTLTPGNLHWLAGRFNP